MMSWMSPITVVWLWHAMLDGTKLCNCPHSLWYRGRNFGR